MRHDKWEILRDGRGVTLNECGIGGRVCLEGPCCVEDCVAKDRCARREIFGGGIANEDGGVVEFGTMGIHDVYCEIGDEVRYSSRSWI